MKHIIPKLTICSLIFNLITGCEKDNYKDNQTPVSDAGASQTVTLPISNIILQGSGTDTDGSIVAYLWSQVQALRQQQ